jgi:transaldolase
MTKLEHLYGYYGQSPWLDNLTRTYLRDGTLARLVANGIRGVTTDPTIFARSMFCARCSMAVTASTDSCR